MRSARPRTCAAFTVHAASASAGERPSWVHASEQTSGRLSQNALPGLKSVASATAAPASTSARPGGIGRPRKSALAGSSTPTTSLAASARTPSSPVASRWSTERAPSSTASGIAPLSRELVAVEAQREPGVAARLEVAARLRRVERAALEEDVRRLGEPRRFRQHLGEREVEVGVGVVELGRDRVGAEPGRDAAGGADRAERRELRVAVEPVAGLRLERGRPVRAASSRVPSTRRASAVLAAARVARTVERIPPPAACSSS